MKIVKEFVVYKGEKYQIEWYFDEKGNSEAFQFFEKCNEDLQIKLLALVKRMGDIGEIKDKTKFNFEGDQIFAFKPKPNRFLCFFTKGKKIIITNGFIKKVQKLPKNEKLRSLKRKEDYEERVKKNEYY